LYHNIQTGVTELSLISHSEPWNFTNATWNSQNSSTENCGPYSSHIEVAVKQKVDCVQVSA